MSKPKVTSVQKTNRPQGGIIVYAKVQSRSNPGHEHDVTCQKVGDRKTWRCTCPGKAAFHPRRECDHIKEVKQAVGE